MAAYLFVVVGVAIAVAIALLIEGRSRWGAERVPVAAGAGAYRAGDVTRVVPRRVPKDVAFAAIAAQVWGALTLFVLVPAGALLAVFSGASSGYGWERLTVAVFGCGLIAAVVSGGVHAVALMGTGAALAGRTPGAAHQARRVARHGCWHHALIWIGFPLPLLLEGLRAWGFGVLLLAAPCGIGLLVALALSRAGRHVAALDAIDARVADTGPAPTERPSRRTR